MAKRSTRTETPRKARPVLPRDASPVGAAAPAAKASAARSSLYDRSNGFMLGCFLALIRYRFARDAFRFHRARIAEFAAEAEIPIAVPASQRVYGPAADRILQEAVLWCHLDAPELADFVLLGALAVIDATLRLSDEPVIDDMRVQAIDILGRHGLDGARLYDRYLAYVATQDTEARQAGKTGMRVDTVLTPAMHLLTETLEPLVPESALCFVAMPFKPPYGGYFGGFYRPLATALACRAFRMWGGLSGEAYVELMLAIMRRCRLVIADLSEVNGNVLYEFGVARGLDKRVVPLCQRAFADRLPSNIASDQLLQLYSPREKGWPEAAALRCAAQVSLVDLSAEMAEQAIASARWADGSRLPRPPADGDGTSTTARGRKASRRAHPRRPPRPGGTPAT